MHSKNIYLVYFMGFIDLFAVSMLVPLLVSYIKSLGASPSVAGIISSIYAFIQFFSGPVMGRYSDILGRKICMQLCFFMSFISYLIMASTSNLFIIFLSRIPLGLFKHTHSLSKAYIADFYSSKKRTEILGKFNSVTNMGFIFGPLFGSYILNRYDFSETRGHGIDHLAFITAVAFFINFVLTTLFLDQVTGTRQYTRKQPKQTYLKIFQSYLSLMSKKNLGYFWFILSLRFLLSFSVFSSRYDPSILFTPKQLSFVTAVGGVASTVTSFFMSRITRIYNQDNIRLVFHASILQGLGIVGLTFTFDIYTTVLFTLPLSFANAILRVSLTNMTLDVINNKSVGLVMGIGTSTIAVARFLAPLLAGLVDEVHPKSSGVLGFLSSFLASVVIVVTGPGIRKSR